MNAENRKRENTMDTKTIIVTLVCAVLGSSALTAVVNAVVGAIQKKRGNHSPQWHASHR